uniref:Uncharacterized protein n=1 Tax=Anguilla anguilla TaxID=7936 RepID=A0A0E9QXT1_ANGAN
MHPQRGTPFCFVLLHCIMGAGRMGFLPVGASRNEKSVVEVWLGNGLLDVVGAAAGAVVVLT